MPCLDAEANCVCYGTVSLSYYAVRQLHSAFGEHKPYLEKFRFEMVARTDPENAFYKAFTQEDIIPSTRAHELRGWVVENFILRYWLDHAEPPHDSSQLAQRFASIKLKAQKVVAKIFKLREDWEEITRPIIRTLFQGMANDDLFLRKMEDSLDSCIDSVSISQASICFRRVDILTETKANPLQRRDGHRVFKHLMDIHLDEDTSDDGSEETDGDGELDEDEEVEVERDEGEEFDDTEQAEEVEESNNDGKTNEDEEPDDREELEGDEMSDEDDESGDDNTADDIKNTQDNQLKGDEEAKHEKDELDKKLKLLKEENILFKKENDTLTAHNNYFKTVNESFSDIIDSLAADKLRLEKEVAELKEKNEWKQEQELTLKEYQQTLKEHGRKLDDHERELKAHEIKLKDNSPNPRDEGHKAAGELLEGFKKSQFYDQSFAEVMHDDDNDLLEQLLAGDLINHHGSNLNDDDQKSTLVEREPVSLSYDSTDTNPNLVDSQAKEQSEWNANISTEELDKHKGRLADLNWNDGHSIDQNNFNLANETLAQHTISEELEAGSLRRDSWSGDDGWEFVNGSNVN